MVGVDHQITYKTSLWARPWVIIRIRVIAREDGLTNWGMGSAK